MYKKILCAIDLKRKADKAFEHAVKLAHQFHSEIILLNVNDSFQTKEDMVMSRVRVDKINQNQLLSDIPSLDEQLGLLTPNEVNNIPDTDLGTDSPNKENNSKVMEDQPDEQHSTSENINEEEN